MKTLAKFLLVAIGIIFAAFTIKTQQRDPWPVPDKYLKMANPVKANGESLSEGKDLWVEHCQSCHGKKGLGDGTKAASLKTEPGNFSTADFQNEPDGALFYKIAEGRKDMPSFKKKLPDQEEIWAVVNYIKTFKK